MRLILRLLLLPIFSVPGRSEDHWAYRAPTMPEMAETIEQNPIDTLLGLAWEKASLKPSESAPPRTWVQRAAYTLTGLPATPDQIRRIETDPSEANWVLIIDELLASSAYGERWARHWMDVARYADTQGYVVDKRDNRYPFAYTYRDWLINAFNKDLPYPNFIKLQVAADLLRDEPNHPDLAALGFLTVGPRAGNLEMIDDRVDVITRGFLASTVACARCHKHKFDPITMEDYYSIYSILENTNEPDERPIIGKPADESAFKAYQNKSSKIEATRRKYREAVVTSLHEPSDLAIYLDLSHLAIAENWDHGKAAAEAFKRGRFRAKAVIKWKEFLSTEQSDPRLSRWSEAMKSASSAERLTLCRSLADEWLSATEPSPLALLAKKRNCPLSYDADRVQDFYDTEDGKEDGKHRSALAELQIAHPGSPPRAMSLEDKKNWNPAQIYKRGDPSNRTEPIERQWLSFLGGGEFPKGRSPRLSLAEKIADPANPLTARVMVNRIWNWHFGAPLADLGDFGTQQALPALLPLLDFLAIRFTESGGSLKDLHRLILTSKAFRLAADGPAENSQIDEANSLFWKWHRRRADFESLRDHLLATSGSLATSPTGGRSVDIDSGKSDTHRTLYSFIDRYALATTFVSFDLPHPDHHAPKRVETTVPQQALFLLNSPLMIRQAKKLANSPELANLPDDKAKINYLYQRIYQRQPSESECDATMQWIDSTNPADYAPRLSGTWEVRHAPVTGGKVLEAVPFPLLKDNSWRTGPELGKAPIKWLHIGPNGGHAAKDHAAIIRWRALASGEIRVVGKISRAQPQGATLEWNLSTNGIPGESHPLPFKADANINGTWTKVSSGDTVDFVVRAPDGDSFGGLNWTIRILGRESPDQEPREINHFNEEFPRTNTLTPPPEASSPWADLIQMLWASNEFNFVE